MKLTVISIVLAIIFIGGAIFFSRGGAETDTATPQSNVSIIDGKQVVEINAKGGYSPSITIAKTNTPTVIKIKTNGTFDCSSVLVIPSIGYRKNLPPSGETLIDVPPQTAGSTMQGMCGMGMYNFSIKFN